MKMVDESSKVDAVCMDLSKTFDMLQDIKSHRISDKLVT